MTTSPASRFSAAKNAGVQATLSAICPAKAARATRRTVQPVCPAESAEPDSDSQTSATAAPMSVNSPVQTTPNSQGGG